MSTEKQIEANQNNGKLSLGPKTAIGKEVSSKNATKHGLFSQEILLPNEDPEALAALEDGLKQRLQPEGDLELALVNRVVALVWRLRRLAKIEAGIFNWQYYGVLSERAAKKAASYIIVKPILEGMPITVTENLDSKKHKQALAEQQEHDLERESESCTYGEAFVRDSRQDNALLKLSRYETAMQRNLLRTLHELERMQGTRLGKSVPMPAVVDVDIEEAGGDGVDHE